MATFGIMKIAEKSKSAHPIVQNNVPLCPSMKLLLKWFNQICSICVLVLRHLANGAIVMARIQNKDALGSGALKMWFEFGVHRYKILRQNTLTEKMYKN